MVSFRRVVVTLTVAVGLAVSIGAQTPFRLKLATFAPANTTWHKALLEMKASVEKATAGRVALDIFAGGTQGPESTVVTMMRVGQLNSALLMSNGLAQIDPSVGVFGMPFFLQNDAELQHMLATVGPEVARRMDAKGFQLLNWGSAGWVQIFSKKELKSLDDIKKAKLFTASGDDAMERWYKDNGFNVQPLSEKEIVAQLRLPNGMIDAVPSPAYGAVALQFYTATPYMLDVSVAPLVGATVVSKAAWNKLSAEDKSAVLAAADAMQKRVMSDVARVDAEAVAAMKKGKLTVTALDVKTRAEFQAAAAQLVPSMRGRIVPADIYDMAVKARDSFRQTKAR